MHADEIAAEATAQIRKLQSAGIAVSHIDTHKHTHCLSQDSAPPVAGRGGLRRSRAYAIPLDRACRCDRANFFAGRTFGPATPKSEILRRFAGKFREAVDQEGFATPDGTLGIEVTGTLDETLFRAIARSIPDGTWEFVCHPGYNDADLRAAKTRLRESRETELRVLTLPAAREILERRGSS